MAGKRNKNKQNHSNKNNHNNTTYVTKKLSQQDIQELVKEATQIHTLLDSRQENLKKEKDYAYMLSTKWLKQWKQYVGYENLFKVEQQEEGRNKNYNKKLGNKKPGRINDNLLINPQNQSDYFEIPEQIEEYQYLNKVIREKLDMNDQYIPIPQNLWKKFVQIYVEAQQIKRPLRITKSGKAYVDGPLQKCDFIFINYNQENFIENIEKIKKNNKNLDDILPCKKMQYSEIWSLQDLYKLISQYCLVLYNTDQVNIWLGENFVGSKTLQQMFIDSVKNQSYEMYARPLRQDDKQFYDLDLDEFLKSQQYTLIVQVGDSKLVTAQLPEQISGYCQFCIEKKVLKYHCSCNKMHYCSQQCRIDDQVWHYKMCDQAYDSDDDQQFLKKKCSKKSSICGLKNLGNTCYMNSSIQLFLCLDFIVQLLGSNKYKKCISKDQDDAEMFLNKISKMIKKIGMQQNQVIQPWSLKAQINHFMSPFRGYKQHDAIDFITGFLNTINQCLQKKDKQQAYHQIFKQNMMGQFDSLVICPDCGLEVKNIEDFMQLSLPIKTKTNKVLFNYVIFENPTKITYGKAEVLSTWSQIYQSIGLENSPSIVFSGRQGQQSLSQIDTHSQTEKALKKLKKDLLIFPHQKITSERDKIINVGFITTKNMMGQYMSALYGYPFPLVISDDKTMAHLIMDLFRKIYPENQAYETKFKEYEQQYQKIKESYKVQPEQKEKEVKQQKTTSQKKKQEKELQQTKQEEQLLKLTDKFQEFLEESKTRIYVEDMKKIKNICFFCHKKCQHCNLSADFRVSCKQFFGHKTRQSKILIQLPQKKEIVKQKVDCADNGDSRLQQCLALFNQPEQLDEQNAWYCHQCQDMRLAFKQMHINSFPRFLLIQLNRFKNGANGKVKNNEPINYSQYEKFGKNQYHLQAVIVHEGSIEGGHYWAICYRNNGYYIFNDDKVSKTQKYCNKSAYILLYQQTQSNGNQIKEKSDNIENFMEQN